MSRPVVDVAIHTGTICRDTQDRETRFAPPTRTLAEAATELREAAAQLDRLDYERGIATADRDEAIARVIALGAKPSDVGKLTGLNTRRVQQIVKEQRDAMRELEEAAGRLKGIDTALIHAAIEASSDARRRATDALLPELTELIEEGLPPGVAAKRVGLAPRDLGWLLPVVDQWRGEDP